MINYHDTKEWKEEEEQLRLKRLKGLNWKRNWYAKRRNNNESKGKERKVFCPGERQAGGSKRDQYECRDFFETI